MQHFDPDTIRQYFPQLYEIPQPPKQLYVSGTSSALTTITHTIPVAFVGSRRCTSYGITCCKQLIAGLANFPITIVSGLALGIDRVAHETALDVGLPTIALPGSGLAPEVLYPAQHYSLACRITEHDGILLSEYDPHTKARPWMFPQRNRLMAGISTMIVIIESEEKSGTLITARLGTEYNKIVAAVPGPVTAPHSKGTNWLLKQGAVVITCADDILQELQLIEPFTENTATPSLPLNLSPQEITILSTLAEPLTKDALITQTALSATEVLVALSSLEIKGMVTTAGVLVQRIV